MEPSVKPAGGETILYLGLKYRKLISIVVSVVVVGVAGSLLWIRYQNHREKEAALKLSRIAIYLNPALTINQVNGIGEADSKTKQPINPLRLAIEGDGPVIGLQEIVRQYGQGIGKTPSGTMAKLLLANAWYSLGDINNAEKLFEEASPDDPDLAAGAIAGAADCHADKKEFELAAETYQKAAEKAGNNTLKAQYLASAASNLLAARQPAKATALCKTIIATYPNTTGSALAQRTLWQITP